MQDLTPNDIPEDAGIPYITTGIAIYFPADPQLYFTNSLECIAALRWYIKKTFEKGDADKPERKVRVDGMYPGNERVGKMHDRDEVTDIVWEKLNELCEFYGKTAEDAIIEDNLIDLDEV